MGYQVKKHRSSWRLIHRSYEGSKHKDEHVKELSFVSLGFTKEMTIEQARARASQLNVRRLAEDKVKLAIDRRIKNDEQLETVYVPRALAEEFNDRLEEKNFGAEKHLQKTRSCWEVVKLIVIEGRLDPKDYGDRFERIYKFLIKRQYSPDYCKNIIRVLNMWGAFVCRTRGQFYEDVPQPRGKYRVMIEEAYLESDRYRGESDPISPDALMKAKDAFAHLPGQWEWLYLSVWLGLRPEEVDQLKNGKTWKLGEKEGVIILWVNQSKLKSLSPDKRWKPIPLLFEEQKVCLKLIQESEFEQPLAKTIRGTFGERTTAYGGRKGFTKLMRDRGQLLEDVSRWMGHTTIERTYQDYMDKKDVGFKKPA